MKKLLTSILAFMMAFTLVGCGSDEADNTITVAIGGDMSYLDPAIVDDSVTSNVLAQCYEGLYTLTQDGGVIPQLATDAPVVSKDGLTYTITLKDGVKWSDGTDLKASDFVYAWKRATAIGAGTAYYSTFISSYIKGAKDGASMEELNKTFGAKALDDKTIEITLAKPCAYYDKMLSHTAYYPVNEAYVSASEDELSSVWATNEDVPYLGAFKVTSYDSKSECTVEKNDQYYAADEVKLDGIEFLVMPDFDAQTSGYQQGSIDLATSVNNDTVEADEELLKQVYTIDPFVCNYFVLMNASETDREELKDPEIRKAIAMSINREDMLTVLNYGDTASQLYGLTPSGIKGANDEDFRAQQDKVSKQSDYNLKEAQKILAAKGYGPDNMLVLEYSYNDNTMHKTVAESMQASMKEAYIDLQLNAMEKEAFFDARDRGEFELARHAMSADYLDPMCYLSMFYEFNLGANTVDDQKYYDMISAAEKMSGDERMNKLHEAENYLVQEMNYVVPLFSYGQKFLKNPSLEGVTSSPEGHYNLTRASLAK